MLEGERSREKLQSGFLSGAGGRVGNDKGEQCNQERNKVTYFL